MGTRTYSRRRADGTRVLTALGRRAGYTLGASGRAIRPAGAAGAPAAVTPATAPAAAPAPAPVAAPAPAPVTNADATTFDFTGQGTPVRQRSQTDLVNAWSRTSAATLAQAFSGSVDANWRNIMNLPTPNELLGTLDTQVQQRLAAGVVPTARSVNNILNPLRQAGFADYTSAVQAGGYDGLPKITQALFRQQSSYAKDFIATLGTQVQAIAKTPAFQGLSAQDQARVITGLDTLAGLAMVKGRLYELGVVTKGSSTAKGKVLTQEQNKITAEQRRVASEINALLGGSATGGVPKQGQPVYDAYKSLVSGIQNQMFRRSNTYVTTAAQGLAALNLSND